MRMRTLNMELGFTAGVIHVVKVEMIGIMKNVEAAEDTAGMKRSTWGEGTEVMKGTHIGGMEKMRSEISMEIEGAEEMRKKSVEVEEMKGIGKWILPRDLNMTILGQVREGMIMTGVMMDGPGAETETACYLGANLYMCCCYVKAGCSSNWQVRAGPGMPGFDEGGGWSDGDALCRKVYVTHALFCID
uniref:Uncharacterized protein n=1 Tax=Davidia involucrata TaxID=16924 RepID=A0A5B7AER7_DAVIN